MNVQAKQFFFLILISILSCDPIIGYKYNHGELPETPVNLEDFNSPYDDYNSTAPSLGYLIPFCFSTNRHGEGGNFDVVYMPMNVNFSKTTGQLKVTNKYANYGIWANEYDVLLQGVQRVESAGNEFGPYLYPEQRYMTGDYQFLLMYATDLGGDFNIGFTFNTDSTAFSECSPIRFLNSEFNDLYPAFDSSMTHIYFCSDRENGVYNIFHTEINPEDAELSVVLSDTLSHDIVLDLTLSGDYDDKCPFIFNNTMVFASNRQGGYGGFDLYYSTFVDQQWTNPVNFGESINTAADEYRPILLDEGVDHTRHMMVFSSDRSGGLGGFDLYFVGVAMD